MLRYFEKKSASQIAATLDITTDAAQKRVSRALERMREIFAQRGVTIGASSLAVAMTASAVQAAPPGLVLSTISAVALTSAAV